MTRLLQTLALLLLAGSLPSAPAAAQELDPQLQEIRTLVREKRFPLALESLRLVARQIQDLRVAAVAPAFPEPPPGWTASAALSLLEEDEIWSDRIEALRTYSAASGAAKMDLVIDVHSPLAPAAALALNPLFVAADPLTRVVTVGGQQAWLRHVPDAGEGELRLLVGRDTLVSVRGRGIRDAQVLLDLVEKVDTGFLRSKSGL